MSIKIRYAFVSRSVRELLSNNTKAQDFGQLSCATSTVELNV